MSGEARATYDAKDEAFHAEALTLAQSQAFMETDDAATLAAIVAGHEPTIERMLVKRDRRLRAEAIVRERQVREIVREEEAAEAGEPVAPPFPAPEDRGAAAKSVLGEVEYIEDLGRPGRIVLVAAEEATGKSYAREELGIRLAAAGGQFAGTWAIRRQGPVLQLSEMHPDDDYDYESDVLEALALERAALSECLYRLDLFTATGSQEPVLDAAGWREWVVPWMAEHGVIALMIDTATNATDADPWGPTFRAVFRNLRTMLAAYPELLIVLFVHLKKPQGRGERRISDVLGEWARWCDVLLLMESDGEQRTKLSLRKRVRRERRIVATKAGGLLVDPQDIVKTGPQVPMADVVAAIAAAPGIDAVNLGQRLGVTKKTAQRYASEAEQTGRVRHDTEGARGAFRYFVGDESEAEMLEQLRMTAIAGQSAT